MTSDPNLALYRRLYAALDNVQESYWLLREGMLPDVDVCSDLLLQLVAAERATQAWREFIESGGAVH